jgi:hypothetical protein
MIKFITRALALCGFLIVAMAQEFPLWEHLLSHYGGKTDETPVPSMKMGNHMQRSLKSSESPLGSLLNPQRALPGHERL